MKILEHLPTPKHTKLVFSFIFSRITLTQLNPFQVRIGTTKTGSQIIPLTKVTSAMYFGMKLQLRHSEVLYPTCVMYNNAGLWSYFGGSL